MPTDRWITSAREIERAEIADQPRLNGVPATYTRDELTLSLREVLEAGAAATPEMVQRALAALAAKSGSK